MKEVVEQIENRLSQEKIKYEIHKFDSGCIMIDFWKDDLFFVIQIEPEIIGLSLVDSTSGFETIPDRTYKDNTSFEIDFEKIFK